jgi:hypothetical protein
MIPRGTIQDLRVQQGDLEVAISHAWDRDAYDVWAFRRDVPGKRVFLLLFGSDMGYGPKMEELELQEREPFPRPSLRINGMLAPAFFRAMGMAADQLGVLPDAVSAKIATLETEDRLLREMLERSDRFALTHTEDLRRTVHLLAGAHFRAEGT